MFGGRILANALICAVSANVCDVRHQRIVGMVE